MEREWKALRGRVVSPRGLLAEAVGQYSRVSVWRGACSAGPHDSMQGSERGIFRRGRPARARPLPRAAPPADGQVFTARGDLAAFRHHPGGGRRLHPGGQAIGEPDAASRARGCRPQGRTACRTTRRSASFRSPVAWLVARRRAVRGNLVRRHLLRGRESRTPRHLQEPPQRRGDLRAVLVPRPSARFPFGAGPIEPLRPPRCRRRRLDDDAPSAWRASRTA